MPTYLCHGFRWQRRSIRVYVVVQNLDDASPEWIIPAKSSQCILESFYNLFEFLPYRAPPSRSSGGWSAAYPDSDGGEDSVFHTSAYSRQSRSQSRSRSHSQSQSQGQTRRSFSRSRSQSRSRSRAHSNATTREDVPPLPIPNPLAKGTNHNGREDDISSQDWSVVKLLEEYDPLNIDEVSRPYAYVADYVKRIDLSASIFEEIQAYEAQLRAERDPAMSISSSGTSDETSRQTSKDGKKGSTNNKKSGGGGGGGWLEQMRDQLQRGEEIKWYVVVNGDEVRDWPDEPVKKPDLGRMKRPTPTKEQRQHHMQYTLQQQIFRENDRSAGPNTGRKRVEVGAARPAVPEKDLPVPGQGSRFRGTGAGLGGDGPLAKERERDELQRQRQREQERHMQKGQSKGGFRRLFGKSSSSGGGHGKAEEFYSP